MQMSLGKFTEQLAGSEAPASVTSPPARHSPRFAKRSKGLTGARQQEQTHSLKRAWKSCGWHTVRVPPVTIIFTKMISFSVYTCHPQNGWWVFRFLLWNIHFLKPRFFRVCVWGCVTCITWHLAFLLSCSKDSKSNAMWQVDPLHISHPSPWPGLSCTKAHPASPH